MDARPVARRGARVPGDPGEGGPCHGRAARGGRVAAADPGRVAVDGCAEPVVGEVGGWERIHADAHHAMTDLLAELAATDEDTLAAEPGIRRDHPQYVWRDVVNHAVREPFLGYAEWIHAKGREIVAIGV